MAGRPRVEVGLVKGKHLSVDGSFVEANAAKESRIPREQLREAAQVHHTVRQYLRELEQQNPVEEPVHEQDQVSTTDPDSTYATRGGMPARLGYYDNYLVDNQSCVIVGVQATAARMSQEAVAAQDMLTRFAQWQGRELSSVAADTTYGNGEFLQFPTTLLLHLQPVVMPVLTTSLRDWYHIQKRSAAVSLDRCSALTTYRPKKRHSSILSRIELIKLICGPHECSSPISRMA